MPDVKRKILIVSPHPDDVAYSSLIPAFDKKNISTIMTIFGRSKYAYGNSNNNNEKKISSIRKAEDIEFCKLINAKLLFYDYPDSSITFSKEKKYKDLYPCRNELAEIIKSNIVSCHYDCVYFPMAIGWHFDHRIIRDILMEEVIPYCNHTIEFIMYEDMPYALQLSTEEINAAMTSITRNYGYPEISYKIMTSPDIKIFKDAIQIYESQYEVNTVNKIVNHKINDGYIMERFCKIHV